MSGNKKGLNLFHLNRDFSWVMVGNNEGLISFTSIG